jgi:hypothetical protein
MEFDCGTERRCDAQAHCPTVPRRSPADAPDWVHSCVVSPARIQPQQPQNDVINQTESACAETL